MWTLKHSVLGHFYSSQSTKYPCVKNIPTKIWIFDRSLLVPSMKPFFTTDPNVIDIHICFLYKILTLDSANTTTLANI